MCVCVACFLMGCDTEPLDLTPESSFGETPQAVSLVVHNKTEVQLSPKQKEELSERIQNSATTRSVLGDCDCDIIVNSVTFDTQNNPNTRDWDGFYELRIDDEFNNSENCSNLAYLYVDSQNCSPNLGSCVDYRPDEDGSSSIITSFESLASEHQEYEFIWEPGEYLMAEGCSVNNLEIDPIGTFTMNFTVQCNEVPFDGGSSQDPIYCSNNGTTLYSSNATISLTRTNSMSPTRVELSMDMEGCGCKPSFGVGGGGIGF